MNGKNGAEPRIAVTMDGKTRHGFLLSEDAERGVARVRFLGPRGSNVADVPKNDILGIVGKTFFSAIPSRPDIGERVIFFDHGRQRKGWVLEIDIERNGRIKLLVDIQVRLPDGKTEAEVSQEEIETDLFCEERWVEELVLLPLGKGFNRLSKSELEELDVPLPSNGKVDTLETKGGKTEPVSVVKEAHQALRQADEVLELLAQLTQKKSGV